MMLILGIARQKKNTLTAWKLSGWNIGSIINVGVDTHKEWSTPNIFDIKK